MKVNLARMQYHQHLRACHITAVLQLWLISIPNWVTDPESDGDIALLSGSPSVRPVRFQSILRRMHWRNGPKCGMLMYPDHLQKLFVFGQYWPNFGLLVAKKLVKLGFLGILRRTHGRNGSKCGMPMNPDHLQKMIRFWSVLAQFWPSGGPKT